MDKTEIHTKVVGLVAKKLGVAQDQVALEKSFVDDLGADSIDQVELVIALEDEFGFDIPQEEANDIRTVADAVNYIVTHQG
jgi:acyl carrier protein